MWVWFPTLVPTDRSVYAFWARNTLVSFLKHNMLLCFTKIKNQRNIVIEKEKKHCSFLVSICDLYKQRKRPALFSKQKQAVGKRLGGGESGDPLFPLHHSCRTCHILTMPKHPFKNLSKFGNCKYYVGTVLLYESQKYIPKIHFK